MQHCDGNQFLITTMVRNVNHPNLRKFGLRKELKRRGNRMYWVSGLPPHIVCLQEDVVLSGIQPHIVCLPKTGCSNCHNFHHTSFVFQKPDVGIVRPPPPSGFLPETGCRNCKDSTTHRLYSRNRLKDCNDSTTHHLFFRNQISRFSGLPPPIVCLPETARSDC